MRDPMIAGFAWTTPAADGYREAIRRETQADRLTVEVADGAVACGEPHG